MIVNRERAVLLSRTCTNVWLCRCDAR